MHTRWLAALLFLLTTIGAAPRAEDTARRGALVERGRYIVLVGHCNNCHTAGYMQAAGKVPEQQWLMGNPLGWRSRSGTTYASNLRLFFANLSEDGWIKVARTIETRPPMPYWSLRDTSDDDLRALYHYIRSLAPLGTPAPAFLLPDREPPRPYHQLPDLS
jgi:mono/diheme cytochrome c family protein